MGNSAIDCKSASNQIVEEGHVKMTKKVKIGRNENKEKQINGYTVESRIGSGSYSVVELVSDETDNVPYAMKVIDKKHLKKQRGPNGRPLLDSCKEEIEILETISVVLDEIKGKNVSGGKLPKGYRKKDKSFDNLEVILRKKEIESFQKHVVLLHEVIDDPSHDYLYLVLEYCSNGCVADVEKVLLKKNEFVSLSSEEACSILVQVIHGLLFLHSRFIFHSDIKPENLLKNADGTIKITDFGVSRRINPVSSKIKNDKGTPTFFPPQAFLGLEIVPQKFDVYCAGVTVFFLLFGKLPYYSDNFNELKKLVTEGNLIFPDETDDLTRDFLSKILDKDEESRLSLEEVLVHPWVLKNNKEFQKTN